jgi:hypothetical protein
VDGGDGRGVDAGHIDEAIGRRRAGRGVAGLDMAARVGNP